jgi:hypothetical protein
MLPYIDLESEKLSKTTYFAIAITGVLVSVLSVNIGIVIGNSVDTTGWYNTDTLAQVVGQQRQNGQHDLTKIPHPHMYDRRHLMESLTDPQMRLDKIRAAIQTAASYNSTKMIGLTKMYQTIPSTVVELSTKAATSAVPEILAAHWIVSNDTVDMIGTVEDHIVRRFALAVMYYTTEGKESWTNTTNWLNPNAMHCDWYGITCCKDFLFSPVCADPLVDQYGITELDLHNNSLMGPIPSTVPLLNDVQAVWFSQNYLNGTVPIDFVDGTNNNKKLLKVYLHHNQLEGTIPDIVSGETIIDNYYVHGNNFNGSWPLCSIYNKFDAFTVDCLEVKCPCCSITQQCMANQPRVRPGQAAIAPVAAPVAVVPAPVVPAPVVAPVAATIAAPVATFAAAPVAVVKAPNTTAGVAAP